MKRKTRASTPSLSLSPKAAEHPEKVREHTEIITSDSHTYNIEVDGALHPENLEITIENIGEEPVVNPRITVNGKYNWYTLKDLAAEVTEGCASDEEKAMAIFDFVEKQSHWWSFPKDRSSLNPVRHFNVYGYHICSQAACQFVALCRAVGLEARVYEIWHHTVAEAKWDGAWHHVDADIGVTYLKDDNRTVASMAELEKNPQWVARTYKPYRWYLTPGDNRKMIYKPGADPAGEELANLYETDDDNFVQTGYDEWLYKHQDMDLTLRPNEALIRWWRPLLRKHYDQRDSHEPPRYANGLLVFEPDFSKYTYEGTIDRRNLKFKAEDDRSPLVHVGRLQDPKHDQPARLRIPIKSPYVIVGAYIDTRYYKGGTARFDHVSLSVDLDPQFHQRTPIWNYYSWGYGLGDCRARLDDKMLRGGPQATYGFTAEYTISADKQGEDKPPAFPLVYGGQSGLDDIKIVAELQVNPGSLPALSLGKNTIRYRDESPPGRKVKVTYRWREIDDEHAPAAPEEAVSPKNSADTDLAPEIRWTEAVAPDGDPIVCYRFQLSLCPDCAWPLCATFDRDVRDGCAFQVPDGWLNPKTAYYWRVKAEDAKGNWSPWSNVFSFATK